MGRPRKWETDAERMRAYRTALKSTGVPAKQGTHKSRCQTNQFIAIDGEALGDHGYHLLAASTGDQIENKEGLSSTDCLRFLLDLKAKHGAAIYCGFALGYDSEHWIRDFGVKTWKALRDKGMAFITIDDQLFKLEYIPRKWFKLSACESSPGKWKTGVRVFDLFTFFQASFISVVGSPATGQKKGWGAATAEEMEVLVDWKAKRGSFAEEDWPAIVHYNQVECAVLVRLANKLREALERIDIRLRSWHGPGAVANFLLKRYNMGEHIASPPVEVQDAIACAYFGGRFQVFKLGKIDRVYDYDISSAYPYATTLLPSSQGEWQRVNAYQGDENPWVVYLASWDVPGPLSPFPWRTADGHIHFPHYGRGWYWGWEVAAARRGWGNAIRIEDGWRLYPTEEGVFGWLKELAQKRVEAKQQAKEATGEEKERLVAIERAYKLALNSVYGKTIQTVGQHKPFLCPMWAGLITAKTRSVLLDAAHRDTSSLVCFATDGLFASAPIAVEPLGDNLGDWELAAENVTLELYQSGCYALWRGEELIDSRFRGIARNDIDWKALRALWDKEGPAGTISVSTKRFIGHRTALQHNKPEQQCQWITMKKDIVLQPGSGTITGFGKETADWLTMLPHLYDYNQPSARYRKLPAGETDFELEEESVQP